MKGGGQGALTSTAELYICSEKAEFPEPAGYTRAKNEDLRATGRSFPLLGEIQHGKHRETFAGIVISG